MAVTTFVCNPRKKSFYDTNNICDFVVRDLFTGFCLSHLQCIYNVSINFILEPKDLKDYVLNKQSWVMHLWSFINKF